MSTSAVSQALGAVVVTYNSTATIATCIKSLQREGVQHIVVVDNNSTDDSLARAQAEGVVVIAEEKNYGFANACNRGAATVHTPYTLFINPDAEVLPTALTHALTYIEAHPRVAVVGLGLQDSAGHLESESWGFAVTPLSLVMRKFLRSTHSAQAVACGWVSGGAMIVRRDVFSKVNGFDANFFLYWEDVDLCRRSKAAGYEVVYLPAARVVHARGSSSRQAAAKTAFYDASADRYFRKYYAPWICSLLQMSRRFYRFFSPQAH